MGDNNSGHHLSKFDVKSEILIHPPIKVTLSSPPMANGRMYEKDQVQFSRSISANVEKNNDRVRNSKNAFPEQTEEVEQSKDSYKCNHLFPSGRSQPMNESMESREDSPRILNYQIKSVRKGLPVIDPRDSAVQRIRIKGKDLRITPYWICQKQKAETKRNATAWVFSAFVTFVCIVCPLTSFASDVAFYVTCSDHYNHTAKILTDVREKYSSDSEGGTVAPISSNHREQHALGDISPQGVHRPNTQSADIRPAPLLSRWKRSRPYLNFNNLVAKRTKSSSRDVLDQNKKHLNREYSEPNRKASGVGKSGMISESTTWRRNKLSENMYQISDIFNNQLKQTKAILVDKYLTRVQNPEETNFEVETQEQDESSACDSPSDVIEYMLTEKAATELEAHRHVTIDIFEPVFILGSFPSLILCILTRLVVLLTSHKNFLSAYVINMACMPLQLVTGALSVHSASYHLGSKGFECWHCAEENDCSNMDSLWWLQDGVTKTLIVSIATKILDGVSGGFVLFVVIIRLLLSRGGHATFWWNLLRCFVISAAFIFCVTVSPLLVITPTLAVMRLEFMELTTMFPGREEVIFTMMILMSLGMAAWCLSFAVLFVYLCYNMYMYCRARTIDH